MRQTTLRNTRIIQVDTAGLYDYTACETLEAAAREALTEWNWQTLYDTEEEAIALVRKTLYELNETQVKLIELSDRKSGDICERVFAKKDISKLKRVK